MSVLNWTIVKMKTAITRFHHILKSNLFITYRSRILVVFRSKLHASRPVSRFCTLLASPIAELIAPIKQFSDVAIKQIVQSRVMSLQLTRNAQGVHGILAKVYLR